MPHTINLFGSIGSGFDPWSGTQMLNENWLASELDAAKGESIELLVNSDGGSVFTALAMHELINRYEGHVESNILSLAASAASFLVLAADRVVMSPAAKLMLHEPYTMMMGNAREMRKQADVLDEVQSSLVGIYHGATGLSESDIVSMLEAETWLGSEAALDKGFVNELTEPPATPVAALLRPQFAAKAPEGILALSTPTEYQQTLQHQLLAVQTHAKRTPLNELLARMQEQKERNLARIEAISVDNPAPVP
jgi:ATP-dependent protease ClpP protease subunit